MRTFEVCKKICISIKHFYWALTIDCQKEYVELGVSRTYHQVVQSMTARQLKAWNKRARRYNKAFPYKTPFKELT